MIPRFTVTILLWCSLGPAAVAQRVATPISDQCAFLSTDQLADRARAAPTRTRITSRLSIWPGGDTVTVDIPYAPATPVVFCARLREAAAAVGVVTALPGTGEQAGTTMLTLALPGIRFGPRQAMDLLLVGFPLDSAGQLVLAAPSVSAMQPVRLSNGTFAFLGAILAVGVAYFLAVLAFGRVGKSLSLNPVFLTAGTFGRASLSQLQIFGFTLLVLGLLIYVLLRTGVLSDISEDVLLLLGISAAGTAGSKVASVLKRRLSFDNWSWLRNQGWLVAYESGTGQAAATTRARWGDLLKTGDTFDVYSFQLATVSLLVGGTLLAGVRDLATFSIPANLMALLGLSNVVYIGGQAVDPNSFGELDEKVKSVREAEQAWLKTGAAPVVAASAEYRAYLTAARAAARMLKSLYGTDGTKFKQEPIADADLAPV